VLIMTIGRIGRAGLVAVTVLAVAAGAVTLPPETVELLEKSPYVYVATERKDGTFGAAAEIWFMWHDGAVWVASPPTTWRAKRIAAGRTAARITVAGKEGPVFSAKGSFVRDPAIYDRLFTTYAKKYPDRWPGYEARFRDGLKDGSRVLIRYEPVAALPASSGTPTHETAAPTPAPTPRPSPSP
jgi:hypothetical protein